MAFGNEEFAPYLARVNDGQAVQHLSSDWGTRDFINLIDQRIFGRKHLLVSCFIAELALHRTEAALDVIVIASWDKGWVRDGESEWSIGLRYP